MAPKPTAAEAPEEPQSDGSKLKTFVGILRKFIGVPDLAAVRFSLPSQLLEPTPNLEYWNYLDAPNTFIAIGTSDDPVDRSAFLVYKDLKYAKGRPCKPYNSCLGEFFRCNWEAEDNAPRINTKAILDGTPDGSRPGSGASSLKSKKNVPAALGVAAGDSRAASNLSVAQTGTNPQNPVVRVSYLTEQTSHHPPVSAFYISCPEKGLHARGFDQITAKFTGTSIKVMPGEHNLGIFVTLERHDNETYQLTHPAAHLGGFCAAVLTLLWTKLKAILRYYDEGWTRSTNQVEGIIFKYDPENDTKVNIKDVADEDILVRLKGPWRRRSSLQWARSQLPRTRLRSKLLLLILAAQRGTQIELEEKQREKARERERTGEAFKPVFFEQVTDKGGKPQLTEKGRAVLERAQKGDWSVEGILDVPKPASS
ncbi:hypothetical protein MCOR02_006209 [Pyricularia oryzae]|nr:hypothetical protein MCOR02_006209 [Pyricularia oryzae]